MNKNAFIDLDGTLLTRTAKIPKKSLESLKKLSENSTELTICTGRWPLSAFVYNKQIEKYCKIKNKYLISMNGSIIYNLENNEIIKSFVIEDIILKKLFLLQKKYKAAIWVYNKRGIDNGNIYCNGIPLKKIVGYFNYGKLIKIKYDKFSFENDTYKVLYLSFNKRKIQKLYNWLIRNLSDYIEIIKVSKFAIEIVSKESSKGNAIKYISSLSDINLKESYAFGDSNNDISMFEIVKNTFSINSDSKILKNKSKFSFFGKNSFSDSIEKGIISPYSIKEINIRDIDNISLEDNTLYIFSLDLSFNKFSKSIIKNIKKKGFCKFILKFNDYFTIDQDNNLIKSNFIPIIKLYEIQELLKSDKVKISINYIQSENTQLKNKRINLSRRSLLRSKYIYSIQVKNCNNEIFEKLKNIDLDITQKDKMIILKSK